MLEKAYKAAFITLTVMSLWLVWGGCSKPATTTTPTNPPPTSTQPPATTPAQTTPSSATSQPPTTTIPSITTMTMPPTTTAPPPGTTAPGTPSNVVLIQGFSFIPNTLIVPAGTRVIWNNLDSTDHSVTSDTPGIFDNSVLAGGSTSVTFTVPGTYAYHCAPHPDMLGRIIVQ